MRYPLDKLKVTPHGAFGFVRDDPSSGLCSSGNYPCVHWGVDLAAPEGTPVYAPEPLLVLVAANRNDLKPFSRYGPAFVYAKGLTSGWWHLFAHLKPGSIRTAGGGNVTNPSDPTDNTLITLGEPYTMPEGMALGTVSDKKHLHWEVQAGTRVPAGGSVQDPDAWWRRVKAVDVRSGIRVDPIAWMERQMGESAPVQRSSSAPLLLLLGLWWLDNRRS